MRKSHFLKYFLPVKCCRKCPPNKVEEKAINTVFFLIRIKSLPLVLTKTSIHQARWAHDTAAALALKIAHRTSSPAPRWWSWTASPRWTRPCWWTASSACRKLSLASRKKSSSWRITSSNWWRRSARRPSEWPSSVDEAEKGEIHLH